LPRIVSIEEQCHLFVEQVVEGGETQEEGETRGDAIHKEWASNQLMMIQYRIWDDALETRAFEKRFGEFE